MKKKTVILITLSILFIIGVFSFIYYQKIFSQNVLKTSSIYIKSNDKFTDLVEKISPLLDNKDDFLWVAAKKSFNSPKSGRYVLKEGMSNNDLVNLLRSGRQTPVNVSFNNQDYIEKLAKRIAGQIEPDSISLISAFTDSTFLASNNLNKKSVLQLFIPNTYEFYWDTSAKNFRDRMLKEYHKFWNPHRLEKAKKLNLTKEQVITLASIVHKETAKKEEKPIVAGLYLNRLKKGWALQADPTIIYTVREKKGQNFVVKRVLNADLEIDSPYNTYKYNGLPPTLIAMPDISSIDAVLNHQKHSYYYMCVDTNRFGYHLFAKSLAQHNRNAAKYHRWLNRQGINR